MKIIDREYLSGVISVANYGKFSENTLKQVIKIVDKAMLKHNLRDEWSELSASYRVSGKYVESGVNQDDLYTSDFSKSDSAAFNLFIKPGEFIRILSDIEWELNRFVDLEEFNGVQLEFNYHQVNFDTYGNVGAYWFHEIYEFYVEDDKSSSSYNIFVHKKIKKEEEPLWMETARYSIREYTDLILITGDFDGAYQLVAEVIHRKKTDGWTVEDKLNKTSQQLADIVITLTDEQTADMNYLKEENEEFLLAVEGVIDDTLGMDYVIGQKGLIDYFNKISKVLLKKILSGEIQLD